MRRPSALGALLAGLLGATLVAGPLTAPATAAPPVPDPTTSTLRQLAAQTGMRVGTAVNTSALADDATYAGAVGAQFNTVTPENVMKWEVVEPQRPASTSPRPTRSSRSPRRTGRRSAATRWSGTTSCRPG